MYDATHRPLRVIAISLAVLEGAGRKPSSVGCDEVTQQTTFFSFTKSWWHGGTHIYASTPQYSLLLLRCVDQITSLSAGLSLQAQDQATFLVYYHRSGGFAAY
jgi:hypothetical protein